MHPILELQTTAELLVQKLPLAVGLDDSSSPRWIDAVVTKLNSMHLETEFIEGNKTYVGTAIARFLNASRSRRSAGSIVNLILPSSIPATKIQKAEQGKWLCFVFDNLIVYRFLLKWHFIDFERLFCGSVAQWETICLKMQCSFWKLAAVK